MSATLILETHAPEETEKIGYLLGSLLPAGSVVALRGEVASGKTCLVRGLAAYVTRDSTPVSSPTFTLVNQYGASGKMYHVDLYRLDRPRELADLGYEDLFEPDGISAVEWAERAEGILPARRVDILLEHLGGETPRDDEPGPSTARRITICDAGVLPPNWETFLLRESGPPSPECAHGKPDGNDPP